MTRTTISAAARALAALAMLGAGAPALAGPALLVDADSGRVIFAEQATDPWYPASVTKLMTTYLVLREIQLGRMSLDTPLSVSANAARVQPSKMGFKPGTVVTVDNVLKMMLVKSANDLAVVLAEAVGGSVEGFAALMNAEARRLGMHGSYFVNPHGLPDPRQRVTARDLALLARALLNDFPQYRPYFGIGGVQLGKRVFENTNGLIGRYPGASGMKTGFICASGFNVVATAERGGKRLIVVLLGERNAKARTVHAAELFDRGFSGMLWGSQRVEELPVSVLATPPDIRDEVCGPHRNNLADDDNAPVMANAGAGANADSPFSFLVGQGRAPASGTRMTLASGNLIPRVKSAPLPVFTGPAPGSALAVQAVGGKARNGAQVPATAQAFAGTDADAAVVEGSAPIALQGAIKPPAQSATRGKRAAGTPMPPRRP